MTAAVVEATPRQRVVTPGVYDLPEDVYFADPVPGGSLSCSEAKLLLPPSCPALARHQKEHGRPPKRVFDLGHAAHKVVLGVGADIVVVPGERWDTKAAKAAVAEARDAGQIPVKEAEMAAVLAMADALRAHPFASKLLTPGRGEPEQSLFWRDSETGVMRRARLDWLPTRTDGRRMIIPDYKSAASAEKHAFARSAATYGYHMQAATYTEGVTALGLDDDPAFVFVVQEKEAPYLVNVIELDSLAMRIGRDRNRLAVDTYHRCVTTNTWPSYSDDVELVALPRWAEYEWEADTP